MMPLAMALADTTVFQSFTLDFVRFSQEEVCE